MLEQPARGEQVFECLLGMTFQICVIWMQGPAISNKEAQRTGQNWTPLAFRLFHSSSMQELLLQGPRRECGGWSV